jgi:hypothetical protein
LFDASSGCALKTHFVPVASRRERESGWDNFPCAFSGLGHAPSEGKSREITLIFCNGFERSFVGVGSTEHPHFTAVFAGFQVGELRWTSCNDRSLRRSVFPSRLRWLRTRGSAVSRVCWGLSKTPRNCGPGAWVSAHAPGVKPHRQTV